MCSAGSFRRFWKGVSTRKKGTAWAVHCRSSFQLRAGPSGLCHPGR